MNGITIAGKGSVVWISPEASGKSLAVLTIPVDKHAGAIARTTALHVAARLDLPVGQAKDLRLAVDEACALFVEQPGTEAAPGRASQAAAGADGVLTLRFTRVGDALVVRVSGPAPMRRIGPDSLGWTLLCAVVGEPHWEESFGEGALTLTVPIPAGLG